MEEHRCRHCRCWLSREEEDEWRTSNKKVRTVGGPSRSVIVTVTSRNNAHHFGETHWALFVVLLWSGACIGRLDACAPPLNYAVPQQQDGGSSLFPSLLSSAAHSSSSSIRMSPSTAARVYGVEQQERLVAPSPRVNDLRGGGDDGGAPVQIERAGLTSGVAQEPLDLHCADFDDRCRWRNMEGLLVDELDWYQGAGFLDEARLRLATGTHIAPDGYYGIAATDKVEFPLTKAILVSDIVECQLGTAELRFMYWTSPEVRLVVCTKSMLRLFPDYDYCAHPIENGDPGPAFVTLPDLNGQPFQIYLRAENFVFHTANLQGGFAIIDNIEYLGEFCHRAPLLPADNNVDEEDDEKDTPEDGERWPAADRQPTSTISSKQILPDMLAAFAPPQTPPPLELPTLPTLFPPLFQPQATSTAVPRADEESSTAEASTGGGGLFNVNAFSVHRVGSLERNSAERSPTHPVSDYNNGIPQRALQIGQQMAQLLSAAAATQQHQQQQLLPHYHRFSPNKANNLLETTNNKNDDNMEDFRRQQQMQQHLLMYAAQQQQQQQQQEMQNIRQKEQMRGKAINPHLPRREYKPQEARLDEEEIKSLDEAKYSSSVPVVTDTRQALLDDVRACVALNCSFDDHCAEYVRNAARGAPAPQWQIARRPVGNPVTGIRGDASLLPYNKDGTFVYAVGPKAVARFATRPFTLSRDVYLMFAYYKVARKPDFRVVLKRRAASNEEIIFDAPKLSIESSRWLREVRRLTADSYDYLAFEVENLPANTYVGVDELVLLDAQTHEPMCTQPPLPPVDEIPAAAATVDEQADYYGGGEDSAFPPTTRQNDEPREWARHPDENEDEAAAPAVFLITTTSPPLFRK